MSGRPTSNSQRRDIVSPLPNVNRRRLAQARASVSPVPEVDENHPETPEPEDRPHDDDDLGYDEFEDENEQDPPEEEQPPQSLADAIALLAQTLRQPRVATPTSPSKVREPDQFDGSDSRKLRAFLMQLEFNFNDRPTVFCEDRTKVNYTLSYLKGMALDLFEPGLLRKGLVEPNWLSSWVLFVDQLRTNFGPHDPVGDAEDELDRLHFKDNQHITRYLVDFARASAQVTWGEAALRHQFYKGLPDRIKDEIARVGKPGRLSELRTLAQSIDARYWERRSEISRATPSTKNTSPTSKPSDNKSSTSASSSKSQEKKPDNSDCSTSGSGSRPAIPQPNNATPTSRKPELQGKLGKDGKLTAEERQRRFDNKLCMFCGGPGHVAKDCNKRNKDPKARNASVKTTEPATVAESSGSKN